MEQKIKKRYHAILEIKTTTKTVLPQKTPNYQEIGLQQDIFIHHQEEYQVFIELLLEKLKLLIRPYGYFTESQKQLGDNSFTMVILPLPIAALVTLYQNIISILHFSRGLLSSTSKEGCELIISLEKSGLFNIDRAHIRLLSFLFDAQAFCDESLFHTYKAITPYKNYLKYQLDIGGTYLAINYLKEDKIEIKNITLPITSDKLKYVLEQLYRACYYERFGFQERYQFKMNGEFEASTSYQLFQHFLQDQLERRDQKLIELCMRNEKTFVVSFKNGVFSLCEANDDMYQKIDFEREKNYQEQRYTGILS